MRDSRVRARPVLLNDGHRHKLACYHQLLAACKAAEYHLDAGAVPSGEEDLVAHYRAEEAIVLVKLRDAIAATKEGGL